MSEAEKKWREWDAYLHSLWLKGLPTTDTYKKPREAYKAALRAEIEKQNKDKEFPQMLWTISEILNLIDTVTPKQ